MSEVKFSSDLTVKLRQVWGSDRGVPETARVSSSGLDEIDIDAIFHAGEIELDQRDRDLVAMLAENGHTSPFEHMGASFYLHVPIFVMREWMRHRTQSYNEESGRWKVLSPEFYVPAPGRPVKQIGRTGEYSFVQDDLALTIATRAIRKANLVAWDEYEWMLSEGVAKEVARMCLPVNIYTSVIVSANFLNWIRFLNLRATDQAMYEIRQCAYEVRNLLKREFPVSTAAWLAPREV